MWNRNNSAPAGGSQWSKAPPSNQWSQGRSNSYGGNSGNAPSGNSWNKAPPASGSSWSKGPGGPGGGNIGGGGGGGPFRMHVQTVPDAKLGQKTFQLKSITAHPQLDKSPNQNMSPEMLCWDDYRQSMKIDDGLGPMAQTCRFPAVSGQGSSNAPASGGGWNKAPPTAGSMYSKGPMGPPAGNTWSKGPANSYSGGGGGNGWNSGNSYSGGNNYNSGGNAPSGNSWNKAPPASGSSWSKGPGGPGGGNIGGGGGGGPFRMHVQTVPDAKLGQKTFQLKSITAHPQLDKSPNQNMSPEMLCWDDYRQSMKIDDGLGPMAQTCRFPAVSGQGSSNAPASGGGWNKAPPTAGSTYGKGYATPPANQTWGSRPAAAGGGYNNTGNAPAGGGGSGWNSKRPSGGQTNWASGGGGGWGRG